MEYEEENISQEELEQAEDDRETEDEEAAPKRADRKEIKEPEEEPMVRRPKSAGLLLTIFGAVLIVLIGGLASYYYYTFQQMGRSNERVLTDVWDETVLATINLVNKFDQISEFTQLGESDSDNFESYVSDANRAVRDGVFDVRSQTGLDVSASTFASKLNSFLDDYSNMLGELKRIASRADEIDDPNELKELIGYGDDMESSYDALILASNSFIQANLPRDIFDMPDDISTMLEDKLESDGTLEAQEKENRQAAEQVATQFVQAWKDRDADGMSALMTSGARGEFNRGVLEDSSDITSFRIMSTKMDADAAIEISGRLEKETPDGQTADEDWKFTLIKTGDNWLIDTWKKV
ncbi:MAG: hypothetical protein PHR51_02650 [Patescibacteria group bacterium]|nr:hypothetical protein [Patescibacteria group bacterium]